MSISVSGFFIVGYKLFYHGFVKIYIPQFVHDVCNESIVGIFPNHTYKEYSVVT